MIEQAGACSRPACQSRYNSLPLNMITAYAFLFK